MSVVVITPAEAILGLDLVKKHLRVDDDDSDDLLTTYTAAAQANIDGPGGWLGRAIGLQTLELRLDSFYAQDWTYGNDWRGWDCDRDWANWSRPGRFTSIKLPYPPFVSVTSIIYEDQTGADQTLSSTGWSASEEGVTPAFGDIWPSGRITADAVRIQYQAGYAMVPPAIVAALLLMVGDLWANRDAQVIDTRAAVVANPTVAALLGPFRVWNV